MGTSLLTGIRQRLTVPPAGLLVFCVPARVRRAARQGQMGLLIETSASLGDARNELEATAVASPTGEAAVHAQAAKQAVRERVWQLLERSSVALPPGAYGRIPMFGGADA